MPSLVGSEMCIRDRNTWYIITCTCLQLCMNNKTTNEVQHRNNRGKEHRVTLQHGHNSSSDLRFLLEHVRQQQKSSSPVGQKLSSGSGKGPNPPQLSPVETCPRPSYHIYMIRVSRGGENKCVSRRKVSIARCQANRTQNSQSCARSSCWFMASQPMASYA